MGDLIEARFLQHALRAVRTVVPSLRMVVFTDEQTHDLFAEFDRVPVEGGRLGVFGGRGSLVGRAARRCGADTVLACISCPLPPHGTYSQTLFATDLSFLGPVAGRLPGCLAKALRAPAGVLCASHALQKLCSARLGLGLERIHVAPPGVSPEFQQDLAPVAEPPYAVFPINRHTMPCVGALREAIKKRPGLFPPLVVVVGPETAQEPRDWGCGTVRIEQCPDAVLASLLRHADLLLYPAVDDGCAMTVIEGLRAGAPILTARSGAPAEWGGNVPIYCEPENSTSIIQALRRLQDESKTERQDRLAQGRSAASEATWERCAWKILAAVKHA